MTDEQEIEIKRLGPGDAKLLDRVAEDVFDEPVDPARTAAYLAEPGHILLVARCGGVVVGQCAAVIHRHPDKPMELYVDEVGVAQGFRRRGIARRLLGAMLDLGRAAGCAEAWVGTEPDNAAARALYESCGGRAETFVMYEVGLVAADGTSE